MRWFVFIALLLNWSWFVSVGLEPQSCRVLGDELANSANTAAASTTAANTAAARSIDGPDWVRVTAEAPWQARDSQGEVVFRDQLWLLGGWFNSFAAPPRDVWSSADGKSWRQVTAEAPWKHSDLPMTVTHNDRLWLMGGWYNGRLPGHSASNEVWSTGDGVNWRCDTEKAPWSARLAAGLVQFKGKMWLLGGTENYYFGDERSLKNDVWSSVDGREWTCVTEHAGWAPRAYHQAAVLGDKLYVFGGGNYVPKYQAFNDVWCSEDGEHWTCVTERAGWSPRMWFSAVTYRDHLWVLGGWSNNPSRNWGDVWFSPDGKEWTELKSKQIWKERHEHSAYLFQDKIWVAGGHAQPLSNEVWSLDVPRDLLATKPTITPARSESPAPFTAPAPSTAPAPTSSTKRPNIILMIADDLGCTDAAPYEPQAARTPQLARLAREGLRFERAYLTCSSCSPSRSSLITSRYPHNTGASELHQPLPADQVTFVERLRESGYWTAAAGKWHLGPHAKKRFDLVVEAGQALPAGIKRDGSGCEQWLPTLAKRPADKPFFLWLAAFDPHRDYAADTLTEPHRPEQVQVPPYYPDTPAVRRDLAQYYDEVTRLDSYVGQLLDALDEQQLADNTIVLFMTDNGRPFPRSKTTLYDSGIQTPLLIRWPGKVPANRSTASLISSIDIGPTLVEIAGATPASTFQGRSFTAVLRDPSASIRSTIFAEHNWHDYQARERAVCDGRYKLIVNELPNLPGTPPADAVRGDTFQEMRRLRDRGELTPSQRSVFDHPRAAEELFDLQLDPHELKNRVADEKLAGELQRLRAELAEWRRTTDDAPPAKLRGDRYDRETGEPLKGN